MTPSVRQGVVSLKRPMDEFLCLHFKAHAQIFRRKVRWATTGKIKFLYP